MVGDPIKAALSKRLTGKVLVVGIGNAMRADDGAGPALVQRLGKGFQENCLDAGVAPENYLEKIVKAEPQTVALVDAVDFGGIPGEIRILETDELGAAGLSTHALTLSLASDYLKARAPVRIFLIGIQPQTVEMDEEISPPVAKAVERLARLLEEALSHA
jgi:hydrogenase 3 maturation protease